MCGVNDKGVPIEVRVSLKTICPVLLPTANMFLDCGCHAKLRGEFSNGEESVGKKCERKNLLINTTILLDSNTISLSGR